MVIAGAAIFDRPARMKRVLIIKRPTAGKTVVTTLGMFEGTTLVSE
jgi:hypothetical protein